MVSWIVVSANLGSGEFEGKARVTGVSTMTGIVKFVGSIAMGRGVAGVMGTLMVKPHSCYYLVPCGFGAIAGGQCCMPTSPDTT